MRAKLVALAALLVLITSVVGNAQQPYRGLQVGDKGKLEKLWKPSSSPSNADRCTDHIAVVPGFQNLPYMLTVRFIVTGEGQHRGEALTWDHNMFDVVQVNDLDEPEIEIIRLDGNGPLAVIRMNPDQYKEATCLQKPSSSK